MSDFLLLANLVICCLLTGIIWIIQLVHYPLFLNVGKDAFKAYETKHQQKITPLVAPLMLTELTCSVVWLFFYQELLAVAIFQFIVVLGIWISTFFIQVPLHSQLKDGYNVSIIKKLIQTNWIRTILWTVRSVVLTYTFIIQFV